MSAFRQCQNLEAEGISHVRPLLVKMAKERLVDVHKSEIGRAFQVQYGDVLVNCADELRFAGAERGALEAIEIKTEEWYTRNLFYEIFSNRKCGTPGWGVTLLSYLLASYFRRNRRLFLIPFKPLKEWALLAETLDRYGLVEQRRHQQLNDTHGMLLPITSVVRGVAPYKSWTLFPEEGLALPHGEEMLSLGDRNLERLVRHVLTLAPLRRARKDRWRSWTPLLGRRPENITEQLVRIACEEFEVPFADVRADARGAHLVAEMADGRVVSLDNRDGLQTCVLCGLQCDHHDAPAPRRPCPCWEEHFLCPACDSANEGPLPDCPVAPKAKATSP